MRIRYKTIDWNSLGGAPFDSKAFEAMHTQAIQADLISVKVELPNSNQPAVRLDTKKTKKSEANSMPMSCNALRRHQSVVIAMLLTAVRVNKASTSRCSGICTLKARTHLILHRVCFLSVWWLSPKLIWADAQTLTFLYPLCLQKLMMDPQSWHTQSDIPRYLEQNLEVFPVISY